MEPFDPGAAVERFEAAAAAESRSGASSPPRRAEPETRDGVTSCMAAAAEEEAERAAREREVGASARATTPPRDPVRDEAARLALAERSPGIGLNGDARAAQRAELARVRELVRQEVAQNGVRPGVQGNRWFRHWREAASPSRGGSRESLAGAALGVGPSAALEQGWQQRRRSASNSPSGEDGLAGLGEGTPPPARRGAGGSYAPGGGIPTPPASAAGSVRDSPMSAEVAELARREQQLRARQEAVEERRQERRMSGGVGARGVSAASEGASAAPGVDPMSELLVAAYEVAEEGHARCNPPTLACLTGVASRLASGVWRLASAADCL